MPQLVPIEIRRGTAANWASVNPILDDGEEGLETDTGLKKVGDGTTTWSSLPYEPASAFITAPSAPSSPVAGQIYHDTTDHHFYGWNGSAWKQLDN